jgi:Tfp pilus assembly protein PilO
MSQKTNYSKRKTSKLGIFGIVTVVVLMAGILLSEISDKKDELAELQTKQEQLQESYDDEKTRAEILEEKRVYVKTKKYIEEVAKKLGLVYPDEVIYKPKN